MNQNNAEEGCQVQPDNINHKLLTVQQKLAVPKNQKNKFGGYSYRSAEDILSAVKPLLHENGLTLFLSDKITAFGDARFYVEAMATLISNDEKIVVTALAREEQTKKGMDASQITGAASSYARKYVLGGLFLLDSEPDADATNDHGKQATDAAYGVLHHLNVKDLADYLVGQRQIKSYTTDLKQICEQLSPEFKSRIIDNTEGFLKHFNQLQQENK